jgi:hypothetical protein
VFAVVESVSQAGELAQRVRRRFGLDEGEVLVTAACNRGAVAALFASAS